MMRTVKQKIHSWKVAALTALIPISFFIIACNDQVLNEVTDSTVTQTSMYPPVVESDKEAYRQKHPEASFIYIVGQEAEIKRIISSMKASGVGIIVKTYDWSSEGVDKKGLLVTMLSDHAKALRTEEKIFTVVEESASFNGGEPALIKHLENNIRYPETARNAGKRGTVYIEFVINENGVPGDFKVLRSVDPDLDAEALRAVKTLPAWNPGKQHGVAVKQRYVLPISFNPDFPQDQVKTIKAGLYKMDVTFNKANSNGKTIVTGSVLNQENQKPLPGASVVIYGTTTGTVTDANGNFRIEVPEEKGQLVLSFVGYQFEKINF